MKHRPAPANLAIHLPRPSRLGSVFRRCEPLLRIGQLILLFWVGLAGARLLAHAVVHGFMLLAGLPS